MGLGSSDNQYKVLPARSDNRQYVRIPLPTVLVTVAADPPPGVYTIKPRCFRFPSHRFRMSRKSGFVLSIDKVIQGQTLNGLSLASSR